MHKAISFFYRTQTTIFNRSASQRSLNKKKKHTNYLIRTIFFKCQQQLFLFISLFIRHLTRTAIWTPSVYYNCVIFSAIIGKNNKNKIQIIRHQV